MENKYGYKVCYRRQGSNRLKLFLVTDSYDLAKWHIRWYTTKSPPDKLKLKPSEKIIWLIIPIKTLFEYKLRWKGCPF